MANRRFELAVALLQAGPRPSPADETSPARERELPMSTNRLPITSPAAGTSKAQTVQIPVKGRLTGVEIFVDTPDAGDKVSLVLGERILVDRLFVDLANRSSYEKELDEDVEPGDILALFYFNAGTSSKTASWTPQFRRTEP